MHFIVSADTYETVITHIFTPDCPYLAEDTVFGVKESLVGDFKLVEDLTEAKKHGFVGPFWTVDWDFVLASRTP